MTRNRNEYVNCRRIGVLIPRASWWRMIPLFHLHVEDDPDVIIPDSIARPLLVSSNLMIGTAVLAFTRGAWPLGGAAIFCWITSLLHWYSPRFSSWRRKADYAAVASVVAIGSWMAIVSTRSPEWTVTYFGGLAVIGIIFTTNETLYYFQLQRTPTGGMMSSSESSPLSEISSRCLAPKAGTAARRWAYTRAVWVHLLCVHVLASTLACVLLLYGVCPQRGLPAKCEDVG